MAKCSVVSLLTKTAKEEQLAKSSRQRNYGERQAEEERYGTVLQRDKKKSVE